MMIARRWLLCAVLLGGCEGERRDLLEAQRLHGENIAMVAALAPFLDLHAADRQGAGHREAALRARAEIVKAAVSSAAHREPPEARGPARSVARLALGFDAIVKPCAVLGGEEAQDQLRRAAECREGLRGLDWVLGIEGRRAARAGLPAGTIPRLAGAALTPAAQEEAAALSALATPKAAEAQRRRLWQDPKATEAQLRAACVAAQGEAVGQVAQEIVEACRRLEDVLDLLGQLAQCRGEEGCSSVSLCAGLREQRQRLQEQQDRRSEQDVWVPVAVHGRVEGAVRICEERARQAVAAARD